MYGSGESTDARRLAEPRTQGLVGNIRDPHPRLDGERADRLSGVGDAGKDDRAVGAAADSGTPETAGVVREDAFAA